MIPKLVNVSEIPLQIHTRKVDRVWLQRLYTRAFKRQSTIDLMNFNENLHIPIDKFSEASIVQDIINLVTESLDNEKQPWQLVLL